MYYTTIYVIIVVTIIVCLSNIKERQKIGGSQLIEDISSKVSTSGCGFLYVGGLNKYGDSAFTPRQEFQEIERCFESIILHNIDEYKTDFENATDEGYSIKTLSDCVEEIRDIYINKESHTNHGLVKLMSGVSNADIFLNDNFNMVYKIKIYNNVSRDVIMKTAAKSFFEIAMYLYLQKEENELIDESIVRCHGAYYFENGNTSYLCIFLDKYDEGLNPSNPHEFSKTTEYSKIACMYTYLFLHEKGIILSDHSKWDWNMCFYENGQGTSYDVKLCDFDIFTFATDLSKPEHSTLSNFKTDKKFLDYKSFIIYDHLNLQEERLVEDIAEKRETIDKLATSIGLEPSLSYEECFDTIINRTYSQILMLNDRVACNEFNAYVSNTSTIKKWGVLYACKLKIGIII